MNTSERILELIKKNNTSKTQVEKECGLSNGVIGKWIKGEYNPSYGAIVKISKYFNVSEDYLLCKTDEPNPKVAKATHKELPLSVGQVELISSLNEEQRQKVLDFAAFLISQQNP
ncbi:MAG: helix-turn-helix domain-containing protein [Eubacterium sp.]|nr:helix-turn-helix domain-containing protein [Eubacterium sp.]